MFSPEGVSPHRVERRPLVEQVINGLGERLAGGEFGLGEKLPPEAELMAQFGVGRSTLREAVKVLAHLGVLDVRQGDGTYVRDTLGETEPISVRLRRARLREVYEVRRLLEVEANGLAAQRRDGDDLARMRAALDREEAFEERGDEDGRREAAVDFHLALADASKNAVLADLYRTFAVVLREASEDEMASAAIADACGADAHAECVHEELFEKVAAQDADGVRAMTGEMLARVERSLRKEKAGD